MRILVADKLADEGLEFLKQTGIGFDTKVDLKEDELSAAVGAYDALIVRSGAKVTAKVLTNPGNLKAIARAGVGADNIDLDAGTAKGIETSTRGRSWRERRWALSAWEESAGPWRRGRSPWK